MRKKKQIPLNESKVSGKLQEVRRNVHAGNSPLDNVHALENNIHVTHSNISKVLENMNALRKEQGRIGEK